jgi:hypothetical protein
MTISDDTGMITILNANDLSVRQKIQTISSVLQGFIFLHFVAIKGECAHFCA